MFFKDTADLKTCVSVNANFEFSEARVFLEDVDRTILKKYLGEDFLEDLQEAYDLSIADPPTAPTAKQEALINLLRPSTANFFVVKWIPSGQLSIDQAGIRIANTEYHKTAFQWQIQDLTRTVNEAGYNALEEALDYLEANIDDFTVYKNSNEFKQNNGLFVRSAAELSKHYSAFNNSRFNYWKMRSIVKKTEDFEIKAILLPALYNDLKSKLESGAILGTLSKNIVEMVRPAVSHLVIARSIRELGASINPDGFLVFDNSGGRGTTDSHKQAEDAVLARMAASAENDGRTYLADLRKYLEANKGDYPLYTGDPAYVLPENEAELNDGSKNFFAGV